MLLQGTILVFNAWDLNKLNQLVMNPLFVKRSYLCELVVMSITSGKALLLVLVGRHIGDEPRHCFTKLLADVSVSCNPPVVKRVILNPPWPLRPPPSTSTLTSWQSQLSKQKIMSNLDIHFVHCSVFTILQSRMISKRNHPRFLRRSSR